MDWNSDVVWSTIRSLTKSGQDYSYVLTLGNMEEHDVNENVWPGSWRYIDGYLCSVLFLNVFSLILFLDWAAHSKSV